MRRDMLRRAIALLSVTVTVACIVSCGHTSSSDKAGGTKNVKPVVLTLANGNGPSDELQPFAAAVARLSGGTLRIKFHDNWPERGITSAVQDVKARRADISWLGSRAFDSIGVRAFDALHAPFLIDNYALEQKVLQGLLPDQMLAALKPAGVVGLGILPGPMRKPVGSSPLVGPASYRGKIFATSGGRVAAQTVRALGATVGNDPQFGALKGVDGVEEHVSAIDGTNDGGYVTANVNLWPRPLVLFMNKQAFAALSDAQRRALTTAASSALAPTLAVDRSDEKESTGILCRSGLHFLMAEGNDLAALKDAVEPVYARLRRDPFTRSALGKIGAMRTGPAAIADAPTCKSGTSQANAAGKTTPIDGIYRLHTTPADIRAAGAPESDIIPENYGDYETVLKSGHFTQKQPAGDSGTGTYTVHGDTFIMTFTAGTGGPARNKPGDQFTYHWSLFHDQLTLKPVRGKISPPELTANPWRRIGDAP